MKSYALKITDSNKKEAKYALRYKKTLPGDIDGGKLKAIKNEKELRKELKAILTRWPGATAKKIDILSMFPEFDGKYIAGIIKEMKEETKGKKE